jgi:hypothetical protein
MLKQIAQTGIRKAKRRSECVIHWIFIVNAFVYIYVIFYLHNNSSKTSKKIQIAVISFQYQGKNTLSCCNDEELC